jgi:MOSC domain-containing protein YiiM
VSEARITGRVEAIHIATAAAAAMESVTEAMAVAGKGLDGDRYSKAMGTFSTWPKDHEFTLIEAEAIEAMNRLPGISLQPGITRRNITTRGVSLNGWIGREFQVGDVRCRATRLCPPCDHLQKLLNITDLIKVMTNRGGLRAVILEGGAIRIGDSIELCL